MAKLIDANSRPGAVTQNDKLTKLTKLSTTPDFWMALEQFEPIA